MRTETNRPLKRNEQPERPQPPIDWLALLELLESRTDNPKHWQRANDQLKQRALEFDRQRASGLFGTAWQSAAERAKTQTQQPALVAA